MKTHKKLGRNASNFTKLRLLLWKNFLIQLRNDFRIEILLFIFFALPLFFIGNDRNDSKTIDLATDEPKYYKPTDVGYNRLQ